MKNPDKNVELDHVVLHNESYFKITNHDRIEPFFMSIVSDGNHWLFISSNGGLTAGRKNSDFALFPYYTDDKLTQLAETTGSRSIFRVKKDGENTLWEPFSIRNERKYEVSRNLYKSEFGNKILFEEIHHDLGLTFQYQWSSSNRYGFVRECFLKNDSASRVSVQAIDGIQNVLPYGVPEDLQAVRSNLVDAYKRNELDSDSGLGIFALSAIIVDRAEPSEALKANVAWSLGLENPIHLLSSNQIDQFRSGKPVSQENDVKARKGAYLLSTTFELDANQQKDWMILADVNKGPSDVVNLIEEIENTDDELKSLVLDDINQGTENLKRLVSAADGFQMTTNDRTNARHYSNTLFNIMRGGIADHNYDIEKDDFSLYLYKANRKVAENHQNLIDQMDPVFTYPQLKSKVDEVDDSDLKRLAIEYLPLKFSRRHGDPSRPWNKFSINTRSEVDGSKILDYEGNWRDIFQNWEALAHSYPEFIEGMIFKFLNASTFDGYNPYRVTKGGFDWEVIEENDPWSYIGYWGDHQIIYLLKFLEFIQDHKPGVLNRYFDQDLFVYANVPYKIKSYEEILEDPKDSIEFDFKLDQQIRSKRDQIGADGAILEDQNSTIHRVNFIEKILATTLAKLSNFIPEGGIWLNTQRPEWNDANNALVGNGISMVTLYYLYRFFKFFKEVLDDHADSQTFEVSTELLTFFHSIDNTFKKYADSLQGPISEVLRKTILDELGEAATTYRELIYEQPFSGTKETLTVGELLSFMQVVMQYLEHSISANKRTDGMYHAYNLMTLENDEEISISYLDEMLEGQVAVLSSGYLSAEESLDVLNAMKASKLFREDQYSYMLYPNKELPGFLEKNTIPKDSVESSVLLSRLIEDGNRQIIEQDQNGEYHFNGNFNNADSLKSAMQNLPAEYEDLLREEKQQILKLFEKVFNHKAFTGRSGTFFGYEGLGSIYWHMVSKLRLAALEVTLDAMNTHPSKEIIGRLIEHYYEINAGIGVQKSPELYGAFPIDAYSHTPGGKGAQQPGMTGQVKEDILSRIGELGIDVVNGCIRFNPKLLHRKEFLTQSQDYSFVDLKDEAQMITLKKGQLAFTLCQVPIIYEISEKKGVELSWADGTVTQLDSLHLDQKLSRSIFERSGQIERIRVIMPEKILL